MEQEFIEREIARFKASQRRLDMLCGERYFRGDHDILRKRRTAIGEDGSVVVLGNLPNARIVDNQYRKMVTQKANYLVGKPLTFQGDNPAYLDALKGLFHRRFQRQLLRLAKGALNQGIAWLHPCYDRDGRFQTRVFSGSEIIPGWRDKAHTELEYAIRLYQMVAYEGDEDRLVERVELFDEAGVHYFRLDGGALTPEPPFHAPYFTLEDDAGAVAANWARIPLIPFKRNAEELPLIRCLKSLQDGVNDILSNFQNNMDEDARNTILILVNYDGENLGEFRQNLATYGVVKVRTVDGAAGDLRTLQIEVNAENYKAILDIFKRAIVENAMGFDARDVRLSGSPNQMNIQSMYSDIELDANEMETEFQAAFEELMWFVRCHFANTGVGEFEGERVSVIFNRDMLMNESEIIDNVLKSGAVLSRETLVAQHPWVDDVTRELDRKRREDGQDCGPNQNVV